MQKQFEWDRTLALDLDRLAEHLQALSDLASAPLPAPSLPEQEIAPPSSDTPASPPASAARPIWRRLLSYPKSLLLLPRMRVQAGLLGAEVDGLRHDVQVLSTDLCGLRDAIEARLGAVADITGDLGAQSSLLGRRVHEDSQRAFEADRQRRRDAEAEAGRLAADLTRRLDDLHREMLRERVARQDALHALEKGVAREAGPVPAPSAAAQAVMDAVRAQLADRRRGPRETILRRLAVYRPDLEAAAARTGSDAPFIDLGCARGEFLEVMAGAGLKALGVDTNPVLVGDAAARGFSAVRGEPLAYLQDLPDRSVAGVVSVELTHPSLPELALVLLEARRVLRPGGLVLLEAPAEGTSPDALQALLDVVGFGRVEARAIGAGDDADSSSEPGRYAVLGVLS